MSFVIDPRICLVTGREIGPSGHDCCGNDFERRRSSSVAVLDSGSGQGLGAVLGYRRESAALRARMVERYELAGQSSPLELAPAFAPVSSPTDYVPPSRALEFLRARPSQSLRNRQSAMRASSEGGRRDTFAAMLRRMFGPQVS